MACVFSDSDRVWSLAAESYYGLTLWYGWIVKVSADRIVFIWMLDWLCIHTWISYRHTYLNLNSSKFSFARLCNFKLTEYHQRAQLWSLWRTSNCTIFSISPLLSAICRYPVDRYCSMSCWKASSKNFCRSFSLTWRGGMPPCSAPGTLCACSPSSSTRKHKRTKLAMRQNQRNLQGIWKA